MIKQISLVWTLGSCFLGGLLPSARAVADANHPNYLCKHYVSNPDRVSKGSGGAPGAQDLTFTSSWGARAEFKISVPKNAHDIPVGLIVYLHGDTEPASAAPFEVGWDYAGMQPTISEIGEVQDMIAVSVRAPHLVGDTRSTWWENASSKGLYLTELLAYLEKSYSIDLDRVIFTGVSGGSVFLNGLFIPQHAHAYGGGAVPLCGGYLTSIHEMQTTPEFLRRFIVRMVSSDRDFMLEYLGSGARRSNEVLRQAGFDSELEVHEGGYGHCIFKDPLAVVMKNKIEEVLRHTCRENGSAKNLEIVGKGDPRN